MVLVSTCCGVFAWPCAWVVGWWASRVCPRVCVGCVLVLVVALPSVFVGWGYPSCWGGNTHSSVPDVRGVHGWSI